MEIMVTELEPVSTQIKHRSERCPRSKTIILYIGRVAAGRFNPILEEHLSKCDHCKDSMTAIQDALEEFFGG